MMTITQIIRPTKSPRKPTRPVLVILVSMLFNVSVPVIAHEEETTKTKPRYALLAGKIITSAGDPIDNGTILISNGKIEAIGPRNQIKIPDGYEDADIVIKNGPVLEPSSAVIKVLIDGNVVYDAARDRRIF